MINISLRLANFLVDSSSISFCTLSVLISVDEDTAPVEYTRELVSLSILKLSVHNQEVTFSELFMLKFWILILGCKKQIK